MGYTDIDKRKKYKREYKSLNHSDNFRRIHSDNPCLLSQEKLKIYGQQYAKKYYISHKTKILAKTKEYYEKPEVKERIKQYRKKYMQENKIRLNIMKKEYYKKNRERILKRVHKITQTSSYKKYKQEYDKKHTQLPEVKAYRNKLLKIRFENDIQFLIRSRLRTSFRCALNRVGNGKNCKSNKYGVDWNACCKKLMESKPVDFNKNKYWVDHIIPLSSFDLTDPKQIKQSFSPENLQWLTAIENRHKGNKIYYFNDFKEAL